MSSPRFAPFVASVMLAILTGAPAWAAKPNADGPLLKKNLVVANNQFAWDLYGQLSEKSGNLFYSPASISVAMSMAMAGAGGETKKQMAAALHLEGDESDTHDQYSTLLAHWNAKQDRPYQLSVANRLWCQQDYKILASYLAVTKNDYHAPIQQVNFGNSEAARSEINRWVEQQTNDKIKNLLPKGSITPLTRLVLTNAIYFKGDWKNQFEKKATKPLPFFLSAGKQADVPLMYQMEKIPYFENEQLQSIALPYAGDDLSMVVILPREKAGLRKIERQLSQETVDSWTPRGRREVMVWLPKFKSESEFNLNATLQALGMKLPFTGQADFSGISGRDDLFISDVVHKAFVDVNEKGTEAAAATGVIMALKSAVRPQRPSTFRADHPFIYFIKDNRSGSILFAGRMDDPR